ncbi:cation:proton antiporter [Thermococcus sp. 2319x1]|uniref:cation:proton antiporter domain-containing protein n=1 Tax=Thermococcus sp. 2319x1 TaxID=1674923 RepID=UPI00373FCD46
MFSVRFFGGLIIGVFTESNEIIREFSNLGVLILLFLAGIESDLQEFKRVGKPSIFVAGVGVASILGAYLAGFDLKASLRIGIGMIPRLGVELAMLTIALSSGVIGPEALTIAIFMVFVTTISTPPLLKWAYKL